MHILTNEFVPWARVSPEERYPSDVRGIKAADGTEVKEAEENGGEERAPGTQF